jgi:DNA-binding response OmpR family regulator
MTYAMDTPALKSLEAPAHPWSCLLLEDDPGFAAMIQEVLIGEGWQVTPCASVAAARETSGRLSFDLMVLDNHLPDGKGFDFYVELAKRDPSQTVIMLTGLPELAHAVDLTRQGLFDYLAKPATRDAFVASIRRAKARLQSRRVPAHPSLLVASSPAMREVALALEQAARHPSRHCAVHRGNRIGQGRCRTDAPRSHASEIHRCHAFHSRELRRGSGRDVRIGTLRRRARGLHRRGQIPRRTRCRRPRRHAVPR